MATYSYVLKRIRTKLPVPGKFNRSTVKQKPPSSEKAVEKKKPQQAEQSLVDAKPQTWYWDPLTAFS